MEATLKGDFAAGLALQDKLIPLHAAIFVEPGVAGAKYALSVIGRANNEVRLPLVPVSTPVETAIRRAMAHAGLLNA
jgi:4-hydroxy-tetrahydrodipicolinate synthase